MSSRCAWTSKSLPLTVQGAVRPSACCSRVVSRMIGPWRAARPVRSVAKKRPVSAEPRNAAKWAPLARQTRGARFNPCRTARRLFYSDPRFREWDRPVLPKKAEQVHGTPSKTGVVCHYLDSRSGEVMTVVYRMPTEKTPGKAGKPGVLEVPNAPESKAGPDVTQRGNAMIGDFRTDALHQALKENAITDEKLIALLVLAFAGSNVSVQSGAGTGPREREAIRNKITEGGVITVDNAAVRAAARERLITVLSCRDNVSNSGIGARIAGETVDATAFVPTMATEEFLSCLSRQALERAAAAAGFAVEVRVKDTRARIVERDLGLPRSDASQPGRRRPPGF